jgi:hypothetical protein
MSDSELHPPDRGFYGAETSGKPGDFSWFSEDPTRLKEDRSVEQLLSLISKYAPHLEPSFVCSEVWWGRNWHLPEAHVSLKSWPVSFTSPTLTFPQMFKYLMYRGVEDILMIFNDAKAAPVSDVRKLLKKANAKAAPIWMDREVSFLDRQAKCNEILDPVIRKNSSSMVGSFEQVPSAVVGGLNNAFKRFYPTFDELLLIGRTDEQAYEAQDGYAVEVAKILGAVNRGYESRAITRLRKAYGRASLPLLCISSVSGIWELCRSAFYRKLVYLVSPHPPCRSPY